MRSLFFFVSFIVLQVAKLLGSNIHLIQGEFISLLKDESLDVSII